MKYTKITRSATALPYHILFIVNDKGGTRKSTLLIFLLALLLMDRLRALAFEIDDQGRVARLFGDIVHNLVLPDADSLSKSGLGDTAILKIEVPEKAELADTFDLLRDRFCSGGEILDLVLCLYLLVVPRIGLRPIEATWARREGNELVVATAKRTGRPERRVPLHGWPDEYLFALDIFLSLVPRELDAQGFKLWRNALASRLARASKHSRKRRRLALYCCRHIAIASWREIGMSPEEIQRLVGHVRVSSQSAYARGKAGYGEKWMFSEAAARSNSLEDTPLAAAEPAAAQHQAKDLSSEVTQVPRQLASDPADGGVGDGRNGEHPGEQGTETVAEFDYEVFPAPNSSPQRTNYNLEAKQHFKQLEDDLEVVVQRYKRRRQVKSEDDADPVRPGKRRK